MDTKILKAIQYASKVLDIWLPTKIKYDKISGISVGIVYNNSLAYKKGFGFADTESKKRASERTLYRIASISKVFTSVAINQLAEHGKLRLDDKVGRYLPWFKGKNKKADLENVTIRQILSHSSGLFRDGESPHWATGKFPKSLNNTISKKSAIIENLTQFKYSNHAFSLLGDIIKKVTNLTYRDYVQDNILNKLGMSDTFSDLERKALRDLASGYGREIPDEKKRIKFAHSKTHAYAPATGFISNVKDLAKFLPTLTLGHAGKKSILGREMRKEIMHPYWKTTDEGGEYGLGLDIYKIGSRNIVGHSGGFAGFLTSAYIEPESGLGVIALSNSLGNQIMAINNGIFETVYHFIDEASTYNASKKELSKYVGIYRNRWGDNIIVGAGDKLVSFSPEVNSPMKGRSLLKPFKKDSFVIESKNYFDSVGEVVKFESFRGNKARKMIWGSMPARRVS